MNQQEFDKWQGCYDDSWQGLIVPEAFAHPAKMAYGLTHRIFIHALSEGWIKAGDTVCDPFGGIGSTGIVGAHLGLQMVCVELEQKFVDMAAGYDCDGRVTLTTIKTEPETITTPAEPGGWFVRLRVMAAYWAADGEIDYGGEAAFLKPGFETEQQANDFADNLPNTFEGRFLRDAYTVIYKEPFAGEIIHIASETKIVCKVKSRCGQEHPHEPHHVTGNFELHRKSIEAFSHFGKVTFPVIIQGDSRRLSEIIGNCDCIVGSPPYAESLSDKSEDQTKRKQERIAKSKSIYDGRKIEKPSPGKVGLGGGYGSTPGNLGNLKSGKVDMVISSPPYSPDALGHSGKGNEIDEKKKLHARLNNAQYGSTPGNLGNLKPGQIDAIVGSPPYEKSQNDCKHNPDYKKKFLAIKESKYGKGHTKNKFDQCETPIGNTEGQLGNEQGETFWQAARQIVSECHKILKPGGYAIWVVKSFVRNRKIVDFPGDWRKLCESLGFETVHVHHAMLVKETRKKSLFGHEIVNRKERKSFFRRLAEQKGSPPIDYEVVLCTRKK